MKVEATAMPEVVFRDQRCTIQYEGEALRIIVSPYYLRHNVFMFPVACMVIWIFAYPSVMPLETDFFFILLVVPPIIGGSVIFYAANQLSEQIVVDSGWLRIEYYFGSLPVFHSTYHFESIYDLKVTPEAYYWCDPVYASPHFRNESSRHIWDTGALAFITNREMRRYVQFGSRLNVEAAETVLNYLWPWYAQYHLEAAG
jgi:hypothetical protein